MDNSCEKECAYCKKIFKGRTNQQKYCSLECSRIVYNAIKAINYKKVEKKDFGFGECQVCKKTFSKKTLHHKICSDECRKKEVESNKVSSVMQKCADESCNNFFNLRGASRQKYCSEKCRNSDVAKKKKLVENEEDTESASFEPVRCFGCQSLFTPDYKNQIFCGKFCSNNSTKPKTYYHIFNRDGFRCNYCGLSPLHDPSIQLRIDHVVPFSRTRNDTAANVITSCERCNGEKGTVLPNNLEEILEVIRKRNIEFKINPYSVVHASGRRKFYADQ